MNNKDRRRSSLNMDHHHHNHNHNHNYNYNHPSSFSSSLLEEIYRSFDDESHEDRNVKSCRRSSKVMNKSNSCCMEREKKFEREDMHTLSVRVPFSREAENRLHGIDDNNNHFVLDQWIEKNDSSKVINSVGKLKFSSSNSSTSSSDSSSGIGGFSSSESESLHGGPTKSKLKAKSLTLKPIRTGVNPTEFYRQSYSDEVPAKKKSTHGSKEGNLQKRALKLYGDLKKVKQPISPGGKLASFLNSLFNSTASKKPKISSSPAIPSSYREKFSSYSTPSTASSYARSCLSKTPSSAGRFERRSVRFCPVNTVISAADNATECNAVRKDEDLLKVKIMEKQRRVEEVAKELLKNYHNGRKYNQNDVINMMNKSISNNDNNNNKVRGFEFEDDDEDEEDDASCCSSDLFELEIGVDGRYHEELPVYETTHVDTNRAIANGFIL